MISFKAIERMSAVRAAVIFTFVFAISQTGYGETIPSTAVGLVGTENNGKQVYVNILNNSVGCLNNGVYFTNPNEQSRTLAVALSAKATRGTVRIDYYKVGSMCYGFSIYQS